MYPTRRRRLSDPDDEPEIAAMTPAQRMELVWPITLQTWAMMEGLVDEPRLRRDVVRVVRGRR